MILSIHSPLLWRFDHSSYHVVHFSLTVSFYTLLFLNISGAARHGRWRRGGGRSISGLRYHRRPWLSMIALFIDILSRHAFAVHRAREPRRNNSEEMRCYISHTPGDDIKHVGTTKNILLTVIFFYFGHFGIGPLSGSPYPLKTRGDKHILTGQFLLHFFYQIR